MARGGVQRVPLVVRMMLGAKWIAGAESHVVEGLIQMPLQRRWLAEGHKPAERAFAVRGGGVDKHACQQNASLVLRQSGLSGRKAQPILLECLGKSGSAIQRGRAAFALGGVGEASVVPKLKELLTKEQSREVRAILAESIRAIQMEGE
jgi:HEAT repeat protein